MLRASGTIAPTPFHGRRWGPAGLNAAFVGDGHWYDLGNGFTYRYSAAYDQGTFKDGAAQRFMYNYASGQWSDSADTVSWQALGMAGLNAAFIGDGAWHTVWTAVWYRYTASGDYSNWLVSGAMRFVYAYNVGQWSDYSPVAGRWSLLGSLGLSSAFLGDGSWHTVWTGVSVQVHSRRRLQ